MANVRAKVSATDLGPRGIAAASAEARLKPSWLARAEVVVMAPAVSWAGPFPAVACADAVRLELALPRSPSSAPDFLSWSDACSAPRAGAAPGAAPYPWLLWLSRAGAPARGRVGPEDRMRGGVGGFGKSVWVYP